MSESFHDRESALPGRSNHAHEGRVGARSSFRFRAVRDLASDDRSSQRSLRPVVRGLDGRIGEEAKEMAPRRRWPRS